MAADNLLFGSLGEIKKAEDFTPAKRSRVFSDHHVHLQQSSFNQNDQVVNEYDVKSTLSSEEKSEEHQHQEHEDKYAELEKILSTKSIGLVTHSKQRILVESVFNGLLGEQTSLF